MILSQISRENEGFDKDTTEKPTPPQGRPVAVTETIARIAPILIKNCVFFLRLDSWASGGSPRPPGSVRVVGSSMLSTDCPTNTLLYVGQVTTRV